MLNEDFFDFEIPESDYSKIRSEFLGQRLDSPLLTTPLDKFKWALTGRRPESIRKHAKNDLEVGIVKDIKSIFRPKKWITYSPARMLDLVHYCLDNSRSRNIPIAASTECIYALNKGLGKKLECPIDLTIPSFSKITQQYYSAHWQTRAILDKRRAQSASGSSNVIITEIGARQFFLYARYCVVRIEEDALFMSFEMFLCFLDVIRLRYTTLMAIAVLNKPGLTEELFLEQVNWQESVILKLGNPGYEIAKAPESLWKCWVSRLKDGSYEDLDSYERMVRKVRAKITTINGEVELLDPLLNMIERTSDVDVAVELFGVIKVIGHPLLDPKLGGKSSKEHGMSPDNALPQFILRNQYLSSHLILKNYLIQNGVWPTMTFKKKNTKLYALFHHQVMSISDQSYPLTDWEGTYMENLFEFDHHVDYLELMQDKSCAPPRHLIEKFYKARGHDKSLRRVILQLLKRPKIDTVQLIHEFANNLLSDEEYNIFLYPKECEFKLAARMFCMLTFPIRLVFSIIQENVKKNVFQYLPYQSMTMDRNTLIKSLLKMTVPGQHDLVLFIEVDLTRWNLMFRHLHMKGYGVRLDKMHGVRNVFARTHEIFQRSLVTVFTADQKVPQLEQEEGESDVQWSGHRGGFEGIDQATWTMATISMIYSALLGENCTFTLLGQGDNQTLRITRFTADEPMSEFAKRITSKIELECKNVNHIAKPEEFLDSTSVLTYSKIFIAAGRIVPMELKFLMGVAPITATDVPSVGDAFASIFSGSIGSAQNSDDPLSHWIVALLVAEDTVIRLQKTGGWLGEPCRTIFKRIKQADIPFLLTTPAILGGLPISSWNSFVVRQEPDELGKALSAQRVLAHGGKKFGSVLGFLKKSSSYHSDPSVSSLITDPASLPLKNCRTQGSTLKDQALETVKSSVKNVDLLPLISNARKVDKNPFLESLGTMRPLFPTLAHDLAEISLHGKVDEVSNKFTMTRSIVCAAKGESGKILSKLFASELNYLSDMIERINSIAKILPSDYQEGLDTFHTAEKLRLKWKLGEGTIEGVSTSHPLDFPVDSKGESNKGVSAVLSNPINKTFAPGPEPPFLGAKTRERRTNKEYEIKRVPGILDLQKAVLIASTAGGSDSMTSMVGDIVSTRTNVSLDRLKEIFPKVCGGTITHRYEEMNKDGMICPVGNPTLLTHLKFITDHVDGVSGSKDDYAIAFQLYFSYLVFYIRLLRKYSPHLESRIVSILLSSKELPLLIAKPIEIGNAKNLLRIDNIESNPIAFVPIITVRNITNKKDIVTGKKVNPKILLEGESTKLGILVSCMCSEASTRAPSGNRLDLDTLDPGKIVPIDATAYDWFGSKTVLLAAIESAKILTVVSYYSSNDQTKRKFRISGLIEKWVSVLLDIFSSHLTRPNANNGYLKSLNLLSHGVGKKQSVGSIQAISRYVINRCYRDLIKKEQSFAEYPLYVLSKGTIPGKGSMYLLKAATTAWSLSKETCGRKVHKMINRLFGLSNRLTHLTLPRDIASKCCLRKIYSTLKEHYSPWKVRLRASLGTILDNGFEYLDYGAEEIYRLTRELQAGKQEKFEILGKINTKKSEDGHLTFKFSTCEQFKFDQDYAVNKPKLPLETRMWKRIGKNLGLYSTSPSEWNNVNFDRSSSCLVLGTGAGGIQSLLARIGVQSVGVDRISTIPPDLVGKNVYIPPEAGRNFNELAVMHHMCERLDVDVTRIDHLAKLDIKKFNQVVWDVEVKERRFLMLPFRVLYEAKFIGLAHVKLFLETWELCRILGILNQSNDIELIGVSKLELGQINDPGVHEVVISVKYGAQAMLVYESGMIATVQGVRKNYGPFIHNEVLEEQLLRALMLGGLHYSDEPDVTKQMNLIRHFIEEAGGTYRGKVTAPVYSALLVNLGLLTAYKACKKRKTLEKAMDCLLRFVKNGVYVYLGNKKSHQVHLIKQGVGFTYSLTHYLPRLLGFHFSISCHSVPGLNVNDTENTNSKILIS